MPEELSLRIEVVDSIDAAKDILKLGMMLGKLHEGQIVKAEADDSESLGMGKKEIVLSIVISFGTSLAASAAYDGIKAGIAALNAASGHGLHIEIERSGSPGGTADRSQ